MRFPIIFVLIFTIFNIEVVFSKSLKLKRSPDFWNSIKSIFGAASTTENPCKAYSKDGDCLGVIDEELVEYKCMFCTKKCKDGTILDKSNFCRRIISFKRPK
ncbi:hypothetical protein ACKWTF_006126 [Chironomus riparius]